MEELIYKLYRKLKNIFEVIELLDNDEIQLSNIISSYPAIAKMVMKDLSGHITANYNSIESPYKVNFEVIDIILDEYEHSTNYTLVVNLKLPNLYKLTDNEKNDLIGTIYYDCYDYMVNIVFDNKIYQDFNNKDVIIHHIIISEVNGVELPKEQVKLFILSNDFLTDRQIKKLMDKMNNIEESIKNINKKRKSIKLTENYEISDFKPELIEKVIKSMRFNKYVTDVSFDGIKISDTNFPFFNFSFVVEYIKFYNSPENTDEETKNEFLNDAVHKTIDKINIMVEMISNPHEKNTLYYINFLVYFGDKNNNKPVELTRRYYLK
jgi:hypothetical protein